MRGGSFLKSYLLTPTLGIVLPTVGLPYGHHRPLASLSPSSLVFVAQTDGTTSASQTVMLSNTGYATLSITGISVAGANASDFGFSTACAASLAPGASCAIQVTFTPHLDGSETASLVIADNASGGSQTVTVSGTGQTPAPHMVSLSWTASPTAGVSSYNLYRCAGVGCTPNAKASTIASSTTSFTDSSVVSGSTYQYAVTAVDSYGESVPSSPISVSVP